MAAAKKIMARIVASRPPGYFAGAMPLLRRFCEAAIEGRELRRILKGADSGGRHGAAIDRLCALSEEQCELAEFLCLLPGDSGKPPPRLQ